jgi:hypothetical protein
MSKDITTTIEPKVAAALHLAIQDLDYGTVEVTVHDSRVVQIEVKRRIRFTPNTPNNPPDNRG